MMDLSVVIVSWNVANQLRSCLQSVYDSAARSNLTCEIIVVDNASTDSSVELVSREFPGVKLIANPQNLGFTRGVNQGLAQASGHYLLLLNPDTQVLDEALGRLVAYLEAHPEVGIAGPQLLNADGTVQSSRRRFPKLATALVESTPFQALFANSKALNDFYVRDRSDDVEQEVDWLVGACLLVRREARDQVGSLDERFFMYFEEVDWCLRFQAAGWRVCYLPQAKVVHLYGQSSEKDLVQRHIHFQDSKCKYFGKYYGPLVGSALRAFLLGCYLYQMTEEGLKFLVGHKRQLRRDRLGILYRAVRSGLRA